MRGVNGRAGWFYLFLIEGLLTLGIGIIVSNILFSHQYHLNRLMNHKEPALLATLSDEYEKHFVPEVMVH